MDLRAEIDSLTKSNEDLQANCFSELREIFGSDIIIAEVHTLKLPQVLPKAGQVMRLGGVHLDSLYWDWPRKQGDKR